MVDELRTLLREAVAVPPEDETDLIEVVRRGSRARRRRTTLQAGLAGVAVLAVLGGAAAVNGLGGVRDATPGPSQRPDGPTLADAVPAAGNAVEAFRLDPRTVGGAVLTGTTEDGLGVLWDESEGPAGYDVRIGLLDPESGDPTWLPASPAVLSQPLALTADQLVFLTEVPRVGPQVAVFDRAAGTWSLATWDGLQGGFMAAAVGPEGRLWFAQDGRLRSGSLSDPTDLRDEGVLGATLDIDGTTLATLDPTASRVAITDLETGEQHAFDVPDPSEWCGDPALDLGDDLVALSWSCGYSGTLADPQPTEARALVMTTAGDVVADVAGLPGNLRLDAHVVGDDVLLTSPSPSTTYDPDVCNFPFDGMPQHYLEEWSSELDRLAEEQGTPDGWPYCQLSHEVYQQQVLPHLDEARVPQVGYGYYAVDGASGRLVQLSDSTPYVVGWGLSGDGRIPTATGLWELR